MPHLESRSIVCESSLPQLCKFQVLSTRFDDYTRTARLEQQLQDLFFCRNVDLFISLGYDITNVTRSPIEASMPLVIWQEVRDWVGDELQNYAKVAHTTTRVLLPAPDQKVFAIRTDTESPENMFCCLSEVDVIRQVTATSVGTAIFRLKSLQ